MKQTNKERAIAPPPTPKPPVTSADGLDDLTRRLLQP